MEMLAGYRCWPVEPLFEMCALFFSLKGNVTVLSPLRLAHLEKREIKLKKEGLGFSEQLKPTLGKERNLFPWELFVLEKVSQKKIKETLRRSEYLKRHIQALPPFLRISKTVRIK